MLNILLVVLAIIGIAMSVFMIGSMICTAIKENNIKKHGTWWGNCSIKQQKILDWWGF